MVQDKLIYSNWKPNEHKSLGGSLPFPQGEQYLNYKSATTNRLQSRSRMLSNANGFNQEDTYKGQVALKTNMTSNQELIEGFNGMIGPSAATKKNSQELAEVEKMEHQFNKKLSAYALAHKNLMDTTQTFVSVTGGQKPDHTYANQNVEITGTDGQTYTGYVTARGFYKPYGSDDVFNATAGKNGCPSVVTNIEGSYPIQDLNQGDVIATDPELFYQKNSPMKSGQACGNEAVNVQVTHSSDQPISYKPSILPGCFIPDSMTPGIQNDLTETDPQKLRDQCSVRASDLGMQYFGITGGDKPACYVSSIIPGPPDTASETNELWDFPRHSYDWDQRDHIHSGLLPNGQLGIGFWDSDAGKMTEKHGDKPQKITLDGTIEGTTPWVLTDMPPDVNGSTTFDCSWKYGGELRDINATYGSYSSHQKNSNCPCGTGKMWCPTANKGKGKCKAYDYDCPDETPDDDETTSPPLVSMKT